MLMLCFLLGGRFLLLMPVTYDEATGQQLVVVVFLGHLCHH